MLGIAVVKVFLQPPANIQAGHAQITAVFSDPKLKGSCLGIGKPPLILAYKRIERARPPVSLSGQNLSEQESTTMAWKIFIRTASFITGAWRILWPYPMAVKQPQGAGRI